MKEPDLVQRAFELLRAEPVETAPDPVLEQRLRRAAEARAPRTRRARRLWLPGVVLTLGGAAFAAGGGVQWLRGWWYGVEVDGALVTSGEVRGDGEHRLAFRDDAGGEGTVRVARSSVPGGRRTELAIDRRRPGNVEHEAAVTFEGSAPPMRRHPRARLDDAAEVHRGVDARGERFRVHASLDGMGGTLLLLERPARDEATVEELLVLPLELTAAGVTFAITETEDGGMRLTVERAPGLEREWIWRLPGASPARPDGTTELRTPDGAVRVRVSDPVR